MEAYLRKVLFLIFILSGCTKELLPIDDQEFTNSWWGVVEAEAPLSDYEDTVCFKLYSDQTLSIYELDLGFERPILLGKVR